MKPCTAMIAALIALSPGFAQTPSVTVRAETPVGALAVAGSIGQEDFDGVPAGTAISSWPNHLDLKGTFSTPWVTAWTGASTAGPHGDDSLTVSFKNRAWVDGATTDVAGSSASPSASGATHGASSILATFNYPAGTVGTVIFSVSIGAQSMASTPTGVSFAEIDIDNDGTAEATTTSTLRQEFPVTVGASGTLDVKITNSVLTRGTGINRDFQNTYTDIYVYFMPDNTATCTITTYGTACGGTAASATDVVTGNSRVITFAVTGGFPNFPVLALAGTQQLGIPLPGNCTMLANAISVAVLNADGAGNAAQVLTVPGTLTGTSFHQFLPLSLNGSQVVLTATNGIRIECVP